MDKDETLGQGQRGNGRDSSLAYMYALKWSEKASDQISTVYRIYSGTNTVSRQVEGCKDWTAVTLAKSIRC